jgi:hypothetical protein
VDGIVVVDPESQRIVEIIEAPSSFTPRSRTLGDV